MPLSSAAPHHGRNDKPDKIWFTRCPVPTATGLAYKLGWLASEFKPEDIALETLQEASSELGRHHYDHDLPTLIREGGSMLALGARAQGANTRLIGLTWIDEGQSILVRPDSGITEPKHLKGLRLALPSYAKNPLPDHVRGTSIARGMSLHGYKGALSFAGLTFDDVEFVEVDGGDNTGNPGLGGWGNAGRIQQLWAVKALAEGKVDAIYVKGASAVDAAKQHGVIVGIDLDRVPERRFRVNNGTPRPITVAQSFLDDHFDLVVRFLAQTLRAAEWAKDNLADVNAVLSEETRGSAEAVSSTYRDGFHTTLHPDLSEERLILFEQQKKFLWLHGFLDHDFDLASWVEPSPLYAAWESLASTRKAS